MRYLFWGIGSINQSIVCPICWSWNCFGKFWFLSRDHANFSMPQCSLVINWSGGMTSALCSEYLYPVSELLSIEPECHHHYETCWRFSQRSRLGYDPMINNKPPTENKKSNFPFCTTNKNFSSPIYVLCFLSNRKQRKTLSEAI